jgi:hypothetical protein
LRLTINDLSCGRSLLKGLDTVALWDWGLKNDQTIRRLLMSLKGGGGLEAFRKELVQWLIARSNWNPEEFAKECLTFGWNTFKARPWFFVGTFALYAVVQILLSIVQKTLPGFVSFLLSMISSTLLYIGILVSLLSRLPMSPAEVAWVQLLIAQLQSMAQAAVAAE